MDDIGKKFKSPSIKSDQITRLAKDAISAARAHMGTDNSARLQDATRWLEVYSMTPQFDRNYALSTLTARGIPEELIVDVCIPKAAQNLGEEWVSDTLSFSEVTIGSAHLQMLLKSIVKNRATSDLDGRGKCFLIVVLDAEQHTLGALVLAHQLRRKGYSLKVLLHPSQAELEKHVASHKYDAAFFSASSLHTAQLSADCVKKIRHSQGNDAKYFLGGSLLATEPQTTAFSEFTLTTNDLDLVIDEIENNIVRVSEHMSLERYKS